MSKRLGTAITLAAVLSTQVGCYTTQVVSQTRPGPEFTDRQWFTIGGLVPLSPPAGRECERGISAAESKLNFTDWLINVGLGLVGGAVGYATCGNNTTDSRESMLAKSQCAAGLGSLLPFLIASRSVRYSCVEGEGFMPRQEGGYRAPPAPEQGAVPPPPPPPAH